MKGGRVFTLLFLAASAGAQEQFNSLEPCGQKCVTDSNNLAGQFGCAAMDFGCLCGVADWSNSIRDCAEGCPPGYAPTVIEAASAVCATATLPPGAPIPTSQTSASSSENPSPTSETSTETSENSSSTTETSSSKSKTSTTSTTSTTSSLTTTTSSTTSTTPTGSTAVPTETTSSSTTSTTSSSTSATATSEAAEDSGSGGISSAGKIGIGVGVAAAVIALAAVAACLMLRRRQAPAPPKFKISHPMPSNEYGYTSNNRTSDYDIGSNELEMKSQRYEDMLPRTEPRQMV
ncbi:hypothetical protein VTH82DRAFT_1729 [Thermothelomyces myriococcoides]